MTCFGLSLYWSIRERLSWCVGYRPVQWRQYCNCSSIIYLPGAKSEYFLSFLKILGMMCDGSSALLPVRCFCFSGLFSLWKLYQSINARLQAPLSYWLCFIRILNVRVYIATSYKPLLLIFICLFSYCFSHLSIDLIIVYHFRCMFKMQPLRVGLLLVPLPTK